MANHKHLSGVLVFVDNSFTNVACCPEALSYQTKEFLDGTSDSDVSDLDLDDYSLRNYVVCRPYLKELEFYIHSFESYADDEEAKAALQKAVDKTIDSFNLNSLVDGGLAEVKIYGRYPGSTVYYDQNLKVSAGH